MTKYKVVGLMSGTSLDGLDLAYCQIWQENGRWNYSIEFYEAIDYSNEMRANLKNAIFLSENEHDKLHIEYGQYLGYQAKRFIDDNDLEVDFVASHGHTSHHRPEEGITFQLGEGQILSDTCGKKVICDFRTEDVSLGGQGAPLVPIGDRLFFGDYDFCLNLGGISNISFEKNGNRIAYDIGLANMPLNYVTERIGLSYDDRGKKASKGKLNQKLLDKLNQLEYYKLPYPKSTGYEFFMNQVIPLIENSNADDHDLLHTFIHHNCEQIAISVQKHKLKSNPSILVAGGGALNDFFIETLKNKLGFDFQLIIPDKKLINFKEALVFALMGVLRLRDEINVLSSVTGATRDSSSGHIYNPNF